MIERLKRYLVLRWLHILTPDEMLTIAQDRKLAETFSGFCSNLSDSMVNLFYKEEE